MQNIVLGKYKEKNENQVGRFIPCELIFLENLPPFLNSSQDRLNSRMMTYSDDISEKLATMERNSIDINKEMVCFKN